MASQDAVREFLAAIEKGLETPTMLGKHEAAALMAGCDCGRRLKPEAVADEKQRKHGRDHAGRYAVYDCKRCHQMWLSWWPAPMELALMREAGHAILA